MMNENRRRPGVFRAFLWVTLGFVLASLTISLTSVGAQVSEGVARVFISNDHRDPIPVVSREELKVSGEVKIDGKPEVKLDGDTKIKIESVEKPVTVRFETNDEMPGTDIFRDGKEYSITFAGGKLRICRVDKIRGTWIYCVRKGGEGSILGWVNTTQIAAASEL